MTATATATAPSQATTALQTPPVPEARPETLGLSRARLQAMSDAFKREIDKGTVPGVTVLVARRGQVGWFEALGKQSPSAAAPMARNSIFRIFSMTKPIVSVAIMALVEDGHLLLSDPVAKFIPEFANQKVGVPSGDRLELVPPTRPMTVQDLLRHTSGLTYEHQGDGPVHKLYQESRVRSRKISNAEHAALVASFPLVCQPGAEFNYSRSTDGFSTSEANAGRLAEPFAADPWTGDKVALFNMLEQPVMESGGGGLVSTTMDYARFCLMLRNGGTLDGNRIIGRKTLELMASDHLAPGVAINGTLLSPGHGFGLGFAVRREAGIAPFPGSVGQYFWSGIAGTFFWIDPQEDLFAVFMSQGPGQRDYTRTLVRDLVYAAVE